MLDKAIGREGTGSTASEPQAERDRMMGLLARLRPIDDELMRCIFRSNLPLAQHILRIVTGIADLTLVREETQLDLRRLAGAHSAELDVWGTDDEGAWYDIEVQRGERHRPRRARYYSAAMDVEALDEGEKYEMLPEQWVIFMMERDPFGEGFGTYHFARAREDTGAPMGDGTHVLYVNGDYRGDDALGRLMHDFCESDPDEMYDELLRESVQYYKREPEGVAQMSEIMEEYYREVWAEVRAEGRAEGKAAGRLEAFAESARRLMEASSVTAQQALDMLGVSGEERPELLAML